ncbi:MAG TPA: cytochrome c oxidase subunit 2A [Geobacterales bacterium]|nr:cytochrome c oxidase subunit 2A [Geobacterales bacterium]
MIRQLLNFRRSSNKQFKPIGTLVILLIYTAILVTVWLLVYYIMLTRGGIV